MKNKSPIILPVNQVGDSRTYSIDGLSAAQIERRLGFKANCQDDPDNVKYSWGFTVDGVRCGVWDYKGSHTLKIFRAFGDHESLVKVFGEAHVS